MTRRQRRQIVYLVAGVSAAAGLLVVLIHVLSSGPATARQSTPAFGAQLAQRTVPAAAPEPQPQDAEPELAVALGALQRQAAAWGEGKPLPEQWAHLGGLTRLRGVLVEGLEEVILLGDADPSQPAFELSSLVVALRNAYGVEAVYQGDPGCTIDPREGAEDPFRIQQVRVFGLPHHCPMAARFVALDYEMKRVAAGIVSLAENLRSLFALHRLAGGLCRDGFSRERVISSTHRFWFHPRQPQAAPYVTGNGLVWIRHPVGVELLTEREFLDAAGRKTGRAPADPQAEEFAASVTGWLAGDGLAPYAQLRNDYRLIEVARVLRHQAVPSERLRYLLNGFPVPAVSVPRFLGEVRREERGEVVCETTLTERETARGREIHSQQQLQRYHYQSRGGVDAGVKVASERFTEGSSARLAQVRRRVLATRPAADSVAWKLR